MIVNWIVDQYILESRGVFNERLIESIRKSGANLHLTRYVPLSDDQDYGPEEWVKQPTVLYGTVGFIRRNKRPYMPGALGTGQVMDVHHYYSYIPNEWLLNGDYIILPWSYIVNRTEEIFAKIKATSFFVRPLSGFKTFTGMVLDLSDYKHEISASQQLTSVMPETLCLIARTQRLKGEFRFMIADGQVIDGSEYRWDDILDIRHDYPEECRALAQKVAELQWQPDRAYMCDVALTDDGPKVVEINSFACAGMYACDTDLIVDAINRIAVSEWNV